MTVPVYSDSDKLAEVERELKQRRRVYPKQIGAGRMTKGAAERQLRIMEEIADDYRRQVQRSDLFSR